MIEFILKSFSFWLYLWDLPFSLFYLPLFLSMFTPVQQSNAWPPMLMRLFSYYRRDNPFQGLQEVYPWYL